MRSVETTHVHSVEELKSLGGAVLAAEELPNEGDDNALEGAEAVCAVRSYIVSVVKAAVCNMVGVGSVLEEFAVAIR